MPDYRTRAGVVWMNLAVGERILTADLKVMSLASYQMVVGIMILAPKSVYWGTRQLICREVAKAVMATLLAAGDHRSTTL
jgi:hypothetical protein